MQPCAMDKCPNSIIYLIMVNVIGKELQYYYLQLQFMTVQRKYLPDFFQEESDLIISLPFVGQFGLVKVDLFYGLKGDDGSKVLNCGAQEDEVSLRFFTVNQREICTEISEKMLKERKKVLKL